MIFVLQNIHTMFTEPKNYIFVHKLTLKIFQNRKEISEIDPERALRLVDPAEACERPDPQKNLADDHLVTDAAHRRVPAVNAGGAVVAHDKTAAVWYLVRHLNIALP